MKKAGSLILALILAMSLMIPASAAGKSTQILHAVISASSIQEDGPTENGALIIRCSLPVKIENVYAGTSSGFVSSGLVYVNSYPDDETLDSITRDQSCEITEDGVYTLRVLELYTTTSQAPNILESESVILVAGDAEYVPPVEVSLKSFDDVPADHWALPSIMLCVEKGAISGTREPDANGVGSYNPDGEVTLGHFLAVVTRMVCPDKITFAYGAGTHWAQPYYLAALRGDVIQSGDFPYVLDAPLSREDMAYILVNAARVNGETLHIAAGAKEAIKDYTSISANRTDAVLCCYSNGLLTGFNDGTFGPKGTMTRAQMAAVICHLMAYAPRAAVKFS